MKASERIGVNGLEEDVPLLDKVIEQIPDSEDDAEDSWAIWYIKPSEAMDTWFSLHSNISIIPETCQLYGPDMPVSAGSLFGTAQ